MPRRATTSLRNTVSDDVSSIRTSLSRAREARSNERNSDISAVPVYRAITVTSAPSPTSMRKWVRSGWPSKPMPISMGRVMTAPGAIERTRVRSACVEALAPARSLGARTDRERASFLGISTTVAPAGRASRVQVGVCSTGVSASTAPMRFSGVKRQSSSRPVGMGKSATSKDVLRSARDLSGIAKPGPVPWVWDPSAFALLWSVVSGCAVVNRPPLPSGVR